MDTPVRSRKAVSEPTQVSASKRIMSKVERRIRWKGIAAQPEVRMREDNSSAQKYSLTYVALIKLLADFCFLVLGNYVPDALIAAIFR